MKKLTLSACFVVCTVQAQGTVLPDPTRPYQFGTVIAVEQITDGKVQWRLSGVRIKEDKRSAILNGRLVKEGDELDGAVVMEIKPSEVTLQQEDKRLVVKLLYSNIKQPVSMGDN
jgi:hypothetical protein